MSRRADVIVAITSLVGGSYTLAYPYGRDQGLFHYAARELLRGAVPFRDFVEHRPPGMAAVYAAGMALFGEQIWVPRAIELLVFLPLLAWCCALLLTPRGQWPRPGLFGLLVLGAVVFQFGFFDFWHTSQIDFTASLFVFAALTVAHRARRLLLGSLAAGLLVGMALLFKPTAVVLATAVPSLLWFRWRHEREGDERPWVSWGLASLWGAFVGAGCLVLGTALGWLAAHDALSDAYFWNIEANAKYASDERTLHGFLDFFSAVTRRLTEWQPYSGIFLSTFGLRLGIATGSQRRELWRRTWPKLALGGLVLLTALLQMKDYTYHYGPIVGVCVLLLGQSFLDFSSSELAMRMKRPLLSFALLLASLIVFLPNARQNVFSPLQGGFDLVVGATDYETYISNHGRGPKFDAYQSLRAANWVREHSTPEDSLAVRAFEPHIYAYAQRRYHGRFFWTIFITQKNRAIRGDRFLEEELKILREKPPRFVVTFSGSGTTSIERVDLHKEHGFIPRAAFGHFVVLEHPEGHRF